MLRTILATVAAVGLALLIGFVALYFSPRDPREDTPPRGEQVTVRKHQPLTGLVKARQMLKWVVIGRSVKLRESVSKLIAAGLSVTVPLNAGGLLLCWGAAYGIGLWAGHRLGRTSGRLVVIALLVLVVIPAPVQIELLRSFLVQHGPFNVRELAPAVLTLGWITFPAVTVHHAVAVNRARRNPAVLLARGLRADQKFIRRLVSVGTTGFWRTQFAMLLVSAIEGPILVEYSWDLRGTGLLALKTIESADAAVIIPLVGLSAVAVNLGVLWVGTSDSVATAT